MKKAECWSIDSFELWCWEDSWESLVCKEIKLVNPKGNRPWIVIGRTDDEAEAPILWLPDVKSWLTGKTLMLGKIEGRRRRGQQRMRWLDGITDSMDMSLSNPGRQWKTGKSGVLQSMGFQRVSHDLATEHQPPVIQRLELASFTAEGTGLIPG